MDSRFSCSICNSFGAQDYASVIRHIGSVHAWEPRFRITCGIEGCVRAYTSYRRYREHIIHKHGELLRDDDMDVDSLQDSEHVYADEEMSNLFDDSAIDHEEQTTNYEIPKLYNKALFLLKLKEEKRLPQVVLNSLIGDISTLLEEEISSLQKDVTQCMQEGHASAELISEVNEKFAKQIATAPFDGLHTSYLQKKYYIDHFHLVVCMHIYVCYKVKMLCVYHVYQLQQY